MMTDKTLSYSIRILELSKSTRIYCAFYILANMHLNAEQIQLFLLFSILQGLQYYFSLVLVPVFGVSVQARHKPGYTTTENGEGLECFILSRGIVLSIIDWIILKLISAFVFAYAKIRFSQIEAPDFLESIYEPQQ